jgi:hypothetical protein
MTKSTLPKHVHTRDGAGHLDPAYAKDLEALSEATARARDAPRLGFSDDQLRGDSLAEELGEDFVRVATSGEPDAEDVLDAVTVEEIGGPFVESSAAEELSCDPDGEEPTPKQGVATRHR